VDNRVRKMVVVDHLVHKYDEILCPVHHGGHPLLMAKTFRINIKVRIGMVSES